MINITDHSLYSIGTDPVSAEQPCGENVRYEADFEQLEAELAKQESLDAEIVDWNVVVDLSSRIIKNSSKDLLVGSYLCNALLLNEAYTGLAVGLKILNDMVEQHWDCLFPPAKRMRARQSAFTWLAEKAGMYISTNPPSAAADAAAVIEAAAMLKQLDSALVDKMGDQAPLLTELSTPLKNYLKSAEAETAKSEQAAAKIKEEPGEAVAESAPVTEAPVKAAKPKPEVDALPEAGTLESEADSKKVLRQLQSTIRELASFWITQKPSDARAYRLTRQAVWMVVENAPPDNNGVTQINPPTPERLKYFEAQQEKADPVALIPELEKTLARSPFWLDGHFQLVKSLRGLGGEYESAAQTVIRELNCFLTRLPEVINLSFADETAFASDQTRMWLDAEVLNQAGDVSSADSARLEGESWSLALTEAKQLAASGKNEQAITIMNNGLANAGQMRDQIYWRCALAELLFQSGNTDAASAILESVSQQAQSRQMAEWEPQLLSKIYNLLYQCYQKQQKSKKDDKSLQHKTEQAFEQLCWFDPVTALSVKGG